MPWELSLWAAVGAVGRQSRQKRNQDVLKECGLLTDSKLEFHTRMHRLHGTPSLAPPLDPCPSLLHFLLAS